MKRTRLYLTIYFAFCMVGSLLCFADGQDNTHEPNAAVFRVNDQRASCCSSWFERARRSAGLYLKLLRARIEDRDTLHWAVMQNDPDLVNLIVDRNADVVNCYLPSLCKNNIRVLPLFLAVREHKIAAIKTLLRRGADVNGVNTEGLTALHAGAAVGNIEALHLLLDSGADLAKVDHNGFLALHWAIRLGSREVFCFLCPLYCERYVSKVTAKSRHDDPYMLMIERMLAYASACGRVPVVAYLLENTNGAGVERLFAALRTATRHGYADVVYLLGAHGALKQKKNSGQALHIAAAAGNIPLIRYFVRQGVEIELLNSTGRTPIALAALSGKLNAVRMLVEMGAYIMSDGRTAEASAVQAWNIPYTPKTPLECAMRHDTIMEYLMDHGVVVSNELVKRMKKSMLAERFARFVNRIDTKKSEVISVLLSMEKVERISLYSDLRVLLASFVVTCIESE